MFRRLSSSIVFVARRPRFLSIGRAPKILDGNTRRNNRRKIIDVVLGTARDNIAQVVAPKYRDSCYGDGVFRLGASPDADDRQ